MSTDPQHEPITIVPDDLAVITDFAKIIEDEEERRSAVKKLWTYYNRDSKRPPDRRQFPAVQPLTTPPIFLTSQVAEYVARTLKVDLDDFLAHMAKLRAGE